MKNYKPIDVLVVEDNPDDSELTIQAVKRGNKNANIIHLWNGEEALSFLQQKNSDEQISNIKLIMLNIRLPKIDGFEVLKKLRNNMYTKFIPVVMLTSAEEESKINEAYQLGANSYVIKPTKFEVYMNKVSSLTFYWSIVNTWPSDFYRPITTKTKTPPGNTARNAW